MGNLSAHQVSKYADRAQKLLDKCTGKDTGPVTIRNTGEQVWIVSGTATSNTIDGLNGLLNSGSEFRGRYSVNISSSAGEDIVPISALAKTDEFGGGAGVAGGSDQTKVVEAGQCIRCAELYGNGWESHVSIGKGETISSIQAGMETLDESWQEALDKIAVALKEKLPENGYWHWQDSFVKSIQFVYSDLEDKLPGTFDRYNPADIWYTDKPYEYITDVADVRGISSLQNLTKVLNDLYSGSCAVGISLKKTTEPNIQPYTGEKRDTRFDLEFVEITPRTKGTLTVNIRFILNEREGVCQIRKDGFGYRATVKMYKESEHYDGSVGKGIIQHCLGKVFFGKSDIFEPSFYLEDSNKRMAEYILNHLDLFNHDDIEEAEELLEGIYLVQLSKEPETFRKGVFNTREMAVAHSLDAIVTVLNSPVVGEEGRKEFLGRLLRYAWSIHTDSCDFLKVS